MEYLNGELNSNPVWSTSREVDPNYSDNMDDYIKAPYEVYLEQQAAQKTHNGTDKNQTALDNIPVIPDYMENDFKKVSKMPDWYNNLEVATPEEIAKWRAMGKMGIAETIKRYKYWELIPEAGTTASATLAVRNANTLRKMKKGEEVSTVDKELLVDFLRDIKEMEVRGGHTLGAGALDTILQTFPYMVEFSLALATAP
ncbi:hypothetical protein IJ531_02225 [bacterium]|nr:hypothetical protein [bacterium]